MIQTKHTLAFFIVLAVLLVGLVMYLLLFRGGNADEPTAQTEAQFAEETGEYGVVPNTEPDKEAAREAIIARLSEYEDEQDEASATEQANTDESDQATTTDPLDGEQQPATSTTDSDAPALPVASIQIGDTVVAGTPGSYCWEGVCETALVTDLPQSAQAVSATGTLAYTIESDEPPTSVFVFWKAVNGTTTTTMRQLSDSEVSEGKIVLPDVQGEYLLFITGQWLGGNEVSNVFKLLMM